eukprot:scaffold2353_cov167-Amphora_coffeaeformis.AAC.54
MTCFDSIPDDALLAIGNWVAATGLDNFARCLKVNRRFRAILGTLVAELVQERTGGGVQGIDTLEHLALWEAVNKACLWTENRLGFDYASVDISPNRVRRRDDDEEDVLDSRARIANVARILKRFPNSFLRIEAHCGTGAPLGIAERFSVARGMSVVRSFLEILRHPEMRYPESDDDDGPYFPRQDLERRLRMTSWGRQISEAAEVSQHHYSSLARLGKGWVELYVCHGDHLEMPSRPDFYQGQTRHLDEDSHAGDDEGHNHIVYMQMDNWYDDMSDDQDGQVEESSLEDWGEME